MKPDKAKTPVHLTNSGGGLGQTLQISLGQNGKYGTLIQRDIINNKNTWKTCRIVGGVMARKDSN